MGVGYQMWSHSFYISDSRRTIHVNENVVPYVYHVNDGWCRIWNEICDRWGVIMPGSMHGIVFRKCVTHSGIRFHSPCVVSLMVQVRLQDDWHDTCIGRPWMTCVLWCRIWYRDWCMRGRHGGTTSGTTYGIKFGQWFYNQIYGSTYDTKSVIFINIRITIY